MTNLYVDQYVSFADHASSGWEAADIQMFASPTDIQEVPSDFPCINYFLYQIATLGKFNLIGPPDPSRKTQIKRIRQTQHPITEYIKRYETDDIMVIASDDWGL